MQARFLDNLLTGRLLDGLPWLWTLLMALGLELLLCIPLVHLHDSRKGLYVTLNRCCLAHPCWRMSVWLLFWPMGSQHPCCSWLCPFG